MFCRRGQDLCDRTSTAVKVEYLSSFRVTDIFAGCLVENFRAEGICLEEGKRCDLEFQSKKLFHKEVLSVKDHRAVTLYHIRKTVILRMENSGKGSFQIKRKEFLFPAFKQLFLIHFTLPGSFRLCGSYKVHKDLPCFHAAADQEMSQISHMRHFFIKRCALLRKIVQSCL